MGLYATLRRIGGAPIIIDDEILRINYRSIETMRGIPMDLILICVRSYDFQDAAELVRPLVGPHTILMPLTSGLFRREALKKRYRENPVIPAAVPGVHVNRNSRYVTVGRKGILWFGAGAEEEEQDTSIVKKFFDACGTRSSSYWTH